MDRGYGFKDRCPENKQEFLNFWTTFFNFEGKKAQNQNGFCDFAPA